MKSIGYAKYLLCGLAIFLAGAHAGFSQHDWTWTFGDSIIMHFPGGGAPVVSPTDRSRNVYELDACYSDSSGNLVIYSSNDSIMNGQGRGVKNGLLIGVSPSTTQGLIILPSATEPQVLFGFQVSYYCFPGTIFCFRYFKYHEATDSLEFPPVSPAFAYPGTYVALVEKLSAVKHADGKSWWVYVHDSENSSYFRYLLRGDTVFGPYIQQIGTTHGSPLYLSAYWAGEMTFSQDGTKLLAVTTSGIIDLFDVDRCTGELSNWLELGSLSPFGTNTYYGCSFSPDGSKIYVSETLDSLSTEILQFDLSSSNVLASKTVVFSGPPLLSFAQHQLGPDGKIYITQIDPYDSSTTYNYYLSVINDPNQVGAACNFNFASFSLNGRYSSYGLPNLPNYNLGPLLAQTAEAGPPQAIICLGDSIQIGYPDTTNGIVTYAWDAHPDIADTTLPLQWVHPTASTWYYVTAVDSGFGLPCGKTVDSIHVIVADGSYFPVADAGNDTTICLGDTVSLSAAVIPGNWTYLWSPNGETTPQISASQPGTYALVVHNPLGAGACLSDTDIVVVDTFALLHVPQNIAGIDQILCPGDSVRLGQGGLGQGWAYAWSAGVFPPDTVPAFASDTGYYVLSVYNPDSLGRCYLGTDTVHVAPFDPFPLPPGFAGMDSTICLGDTLELGTQLPSQWVGSWTPQGGLLDPDSLVTVGRPTVTTTYMLAATDTSNHGSCATIRDTVLVTVEQPFLHQRPEDQVFCPGEILQIGVQAMNAFRYAWSPTLGLNDPFAASTTVAPLADIVYTLAITSDTMVSVNCKTQYFPITLTTKDCIVQNVVTPNGDGINDFLALGTFNQAVALSVYDRWGALVFSSPNYLNDWPNGNSHLPETVYYYVVSVGGAGGKRFVGEVMLLR